MILNIEFVLLGILVGVLASFAGLGGGFLIVPILLFFGFASQKAVGTSFLAVIIISVSALFVHSKLNNVDWQTGLILGVGGVIGTQIGARLLTIVPQNVFMKVFSVILVGIAIYMFFKKSV